MDGKGASIRQHKVERGLGLGFGAATLALNAVVLAWLWSRADMPLLHGAPRAAYVLYNSGFAALAMIIARYGTRTPGTAMFALSIGAVGLNGSLPELEWLTPADLHKLIELLADGPGALAAGAYIRSAQLFPKKLTDADLSREDLALRRFPRVRAVLVTLLHPAASWTIGILWAFAQIASDDVFSNLVVVAIGATFFYFQWRIGSRIARRRVGWLLQAVLVFGILMALTSAVLGMGDQSQQTRLLVSMVYSVAATLLGLGCIAMAVFAAGAFNSNMIVRATIAWSIVVGAVVFVLNVLTSALIDQLADWLRISDRFVAAALGTVAGLALNPIAARLSAWARRKSAEA